MAAINFDLNAHGTASGGTADYEPGTLSEYVADGLRDADLVVRAAWIHSCRMRLFARLGAVLTGFGGPVKFWWPGRAVMISRPQRIRSRRLGFFAGFMSESRGLHWDRRR